MSVVCPPRLFLDRSTAHPSPAARTHVEADDGIASPTPYGWFVYAGEEPGGRVPSDPAAIMTYARSLGAEYVNFDCDASEIGDLSTYDWSG